MKRHVLILLLAASVVSGQTRAARTTGKDSPGTPREPVQVEMTVDAMGTNYAMTAYGGDATRLRSALEQAAEEVRRLDRLLSNYVPASEWSEVNRNAGREPVRVSPELLRLLAACKEYSRLSNGTFDITVGPLMKVWGFYKGSGHLPHRAEVRGALARVGYEKMILDAGASTVRFAVDGMEIDPGGIGKGYAVDKMADILKANGVTSALVSGGGSSIYAIGVPPGQPGWKVTIRNPRDTSKAIETVLLKDQSMSTSGSYEKFFHAEGRIYSHIMDPRTGFPSQGMLSVSVVTPKTIDSEAWAKPYYIQGRQWTAEHKSKDFRVFLCEDRSELACAWLP